MLCNNPTSVTPAVWWLLKATVDFSIRLRGELGAEGQQMTGSDSSGASLAQVLIMPRMRKDSVGPWS